MFTDEMKAQIARLNSFVEQGKALGPQDIHLLAVQMAGWLSTIEETEVFAPRKILMFPNGQAWILPVKSDEPHE